MTHFDVFNGDADGICSLLQLRFAAPIDSVLITGAKRDIALLQRVDAQPGDAVTALDISVAVNRQSLLALLDRGVKIEYFDHHFAGELPKRAGLDAHLGADALCRQFATGGGRSTAAGIDHLPTDQLREFVRRLDQAFP